MVKSDAFNFLVDFFAFPDKTLACLRLFLKLLFNIKIMYLKGMNTKNINSWNGGVQCITHVYSKS